MNFSKDSIKINPAEETERIVSRLRSTLINFRKKGAVLGISGGVDSSVVLALCTKAFSNKKVIALMLPEKDSSPDSLRLARIVAGKFGVTYYIEDITNSLEALGCYRRRDEAVKNIFPEYGVNYKMKITVSKNEKIKGQ